MSKNKKKGEEKEKIFITPFVYSHSGTQKFVKTAPEDCKICWADIKLSKGGKETRLVKQIKDILREEGGSGAEWNEEIGVKVDEFDKLLQRPKVRSGVDLAFCLTNEKILLVDAKFNQKNKNFNNELKEKLDAQVKSSRDILGAGGTMKSPVIVLVKDEAEARRRFYSKQTGRSETYIFMSEKSFREKYFNDEAEGEFRSIKRVERN